MAKVLVIDDSFDLLHVFSTALKRNGYELEILSSADKLLNLLSIYLPDLILLDVLLRKEDGSELCKKIKEGYKNISIILISMNTAFLQNYEECQADAVIEKPFDFQTVIATMNKVLDSKVGTINTTHKN